MTSEELRVVAEDIQYFQDRWYGDIPEPEIRRGAAILRRLLIEDAIGEAWRGMGHKGEPCLVGPDLDKLFGNYDRGKIVCALAGGGMRNGVRAAGLCQVRDNKPPPPPTPDLEAGQTFESIIETSLSLSQYLKSTCAIIDGILITRRELIRYMANIKGGVHLRLSRRTRKREQEIVNKIKPLEGRIHAFRLDGLFFELLSIGQSVGGSPDTQSLMRQIIGAGDTGDNN